jgi:site-specific recombinase XerD
MILGRGTAASDETILAEFDAFLVSSSGIATTKIQRRVAGGARVLWRRIGGPIASWTSGQVLAGFANRSHGTRYGYWVFLAFLLFRGYFRLTDFDFLAAMPLALCRMHRPALRPIRERLLDSRKALRYACDGPGDGVGSAMNLLIYLLAYLARPLDELTRTDFDAFRSAYNRWYSARLKTRTFDPRLNRLERYLMHWKVLPAPRIVFKHEEHFASLRHEPIKAAILDYMRFCEVKYERSTIDTCRAGVLGFFLWLQQHYPDHARLDDVTRPVALAWAADLRQRRDDETYSKSYCRDVYRRIRLFYEFAIVERLPSSPDRNPFAMRDMPPPSDPVPRYLSDDEMQRVLRYCAAEASLQERVVFTTLLHIGIRAAELARLKGSDIVQIQSRWKLHIHEGKGLNDRLIPLTEPCRNVLHTWQEQGWNKATDFLFTTHGRVWAGTKVGSIVRDTGLKLGLAGLTPHRFRHSFAVALLNYGIRESALQKLMCHKTLGMTLHYGRILDQSVEKAFGEAVDQMHGNGRGWVPSFFATEDYTRFAQGDSLSWIRLPIGYCRRNRKLHCESDVKCLLCNRFVGAPEDVPRLKEMHARFLELGMPVKAEVVAAQIRLSENLPPTPMIPLEVIAPPQT